LAVPYIYRVVGCKTCGSWIDVEFLGLALNLRIAGTVRGPIQLRCFNCGESHKYSDLDIVLFAKDWPPNRRLHTA